MVPFVFVKLEGSYIICHLLNYWVQCNAGNGMWWFTDTKYWNIYVREIVVHYGESRGKGEFSFGL